MRILWFSVTPSMYGKNTFTHNGGGWIASLEALIRTSPDVQLGIAFEHNDACFKVERDEVVYYPIPIRYHFFDKLRRICNINIEEQKIIPECLKIIDDFKPDIIHVFGSEWCFGLIAKHTEIPVVIHMQGSIPPYYNARFPVGYSKMDIVFHNGLDIKRIFNQLKADRKFSQRAKREERILKICRYYMGRTDWDKNITRLYNPNSQYFYCGEALRDVFVDSAERWNPHKRNSIILVSTISSPLYKGVDLILKTAKLLKENTNINFNWHIFGVKNIAFHEKKTKIKATDFNIKLMGVASANKLKEELLNADIYIHPSYIENSPNSICEAQILGLPVICTNVGGTCSLVKHEKTGLLFPANDPFTLCSYIIRLFWNKTLAYELGNAAHHTAIVRHNNETIIHNLLEIYRKVIVIHKEKRDETI